MNNYKAVIVGCTKNNEKYIRSNLLKLVQIGSQFNDYKIIIYENDSTDNTVQPMKTLILFMKHRLKINIEIK